MAELRICIAHVHREFSQAARPPTAAAAAAAAVTSKDAASMPPQPASSTEQVYLVPNPQAIFWTATYPTFVNARVLLSSLISVGHTSLYM